MVSLVSTLELSAYHPIAKEKEHLIIEKHTHLPAYGLVTLAPRQECAKYSMCTTLRGTDFSFVLLRIAPQQSTPNGRRRRQSTSSDLITVCEPRFVPLGDSYALVWVCPAGVSQPSDAAQAELCNFLLSEGVIASCQPPNGEVVVPPTTSAPPLETRYFRLTILSATAEHFEKQAASVCDYVGTVCQYRTISV